MGSFITLTALSFLSSILIGILVTMPVLVIYYVFLKRARLYCKVKKQLKKVLQERNTELGKRAKQDQQDEAEFSV